MDEVTIGRESLAHIEASPELPALMAEYEAESANSDIGRTCPHIPTYQAMEAAGLFHAFAARVEGRLVGFMFLLTPVLPHFSRVVGVSESFFVAAEYRKTGAGLRLLRAAEDVARAAGAPGVLVSAPVGGSLERVMPGIGYRETSRVFFKALS
ncbi:GNAT family N-acetyltransferase [Cupriavidus sp. EM10]|uniref:GNAT family N-acetyltransferase n=1 Tax=Cupriavidus sp. EM10 TaxID=2839983 RepID=UPI001C00276B|nr:GNAT family N-acetyltransferase [Cupriavidus sp. EM10]QWE95655.1 GNAT family N-acetyltransferase [Cupriavidus sp. EM10]